jgi:hypothetical protein
MNTAKQETPEHRTTKDHRTAHDRTAQGRTAHDRTAHDRTAHDRTAHDRTAHDRTAQNRATPDRTAQNRATQDRTASRERASQSTARPPRPDVTAIAVGTAMMAGEQIRTRASKIRSRASLVVGGVLIGAKDRTDVGVAKVRAAVDEADRRGRGTMESQRDLAAMLVDATIGGALLWAQATVMPKIVDSLVARLMSEVVPQLVDQLQADASDADANRADASRADANRADARSETTAKRVIKRSNGKAPAGSAFERRDD